MSTSNRAVSFEIRGVDPLLVARQRSICETILLHLNADFSSFDSRVVCLIDDQDYPHLRQRIGVANRGLFSPVRRQGLRDLIPQYFWDSVIRFNYQSVTLEQLYDCLIYVHGSTSLSEIGLTLTLAHELQHFVQYVTERPTWAIDRLLQRLPSTHNEAFQRWADFSIEREARVVAKRVAIEIHGYEAVTDYINHKIGERITDADVSDWEFLLSTEADVAYSAAEDTKRLVPRFKSQLIELQAQDWSDCQEIESLDFTSDDWNQS